MSEDVNATLARWREAEQAATQGPWKAGHGVSLTGVHGDAKLSGYVAETFGNRPDAGFIVTARTAMPRLLAAVEAGLKLADGWEATLRPFGSSWECAQALREAITASLAGTGKEGSEDGKHG